MDWIFLPLQPSAIQQNPWPFFALVTVLSWGLTPGLFILIGRIFENRRVPLHPRFQFLGFFPGDLFLGLLSGGLITHAIVFPPNPGWYTSVVWYVIVVIGATIAAIGLTAWELHQKIYSKRAILSPTKLYHNGLLYIGYGSLLVSTFVMILFGGATWWLAPILVPAVAWAICNVLDGSARLWGTQPMHRKAFHAHKADWQPIWKQRPALF